MRQYTALVPISAFSIASPSLTLPPFPTPPLLLPPSPLRPIGQYPPVPTTAVPPAFPAAAPLPDKGSVSFKWQCTWLWYFGDGGCMSPSPLNFLMPFPPSKAHTTTTSLCCSADSTLLESGAPFNGTPRGSG